MVDAFLWRFDLGGGGGRGDDGKGGGRGVIGKVEGYVGGLALNGLYLALVCGL